MFSNFYGERAVFVRMRAIHGAAIAILMINGLFFTDNPIGQWVQYILAFIVLIHDIDEGRFAIGAFREIQEKAKALTGANANLEKEVDRRTEELQQKNRDLTQALEDLQNATDQLVQTEKLAALGGLVAGMAHEVNTPLGIGVTAASHLDEATKELSGKFHSGTMKKSDLESFIATCQETVSITLANLNRAADLITSFKKIAVDQSHETHEHIQLGSYLNDIVVSLTPQLKKSPVKVHIDAPEELQLKTMPGSFSQVVTNLIVNSLIHAFDEKQSGEISIKAFRENDHIILDYRDDGKGIAPENLPKIFDPFFTTRRGQGGSGLGLHLIHNIITQGLQGSITCESTPGEGTRFIIKLPT